MSENSPPTPVNATIDLEQLQSLIAAQAQVNSTQEVMSLLNFGSLRTFESIDFPENLKLVSKVNFAIWKKEIIRYAHGVGPTFASFVLDENPADLYDHRMNNMLHDLLIRTVTDKVRLPRQELGQSGKGLYLELLKSYGTQHPRDKFEVVKYYWDKLMDATLTVKRRLEIEAQWSHYLGLQSDSERQVLSSFVWMHLSKSILPTEYLRSSQPVLQIETLKVFLDTHPNCNTENLAIPASSITAATVVKSDRVVATKDTVGKLFERQCRNCFGLGHEQNDCTLALRSNCFIPQLDVRLQSFRQNSFGKRKRPRFNPSDAKSTPSDTTDTGNAGNSTNNAKSSQYNSQNTNPWFSNNSKSANAVGLMDSMCHAISYVKCTDFIFDSGATVNLCNDIKYLHDVIILEAPQSVNAANNTVIQVVAFGILKFQVLDSIINVHYVGYAPECSFNLLNFRSFLIADDHSFVITSNTIEHSHFGCIGQHTDFMKCLLSPIPLNVKVVNIVDSTHPIQSIHSALGHPHDFALKKVLDEMNFSYVPSDLNFHCSVCLQSKNFKSFQNIGLFPKVTLILELIHVDVAGPFGTALFFDDGFMLVITDDFSRMRFCFPLKDKSDVATILINWIKSTENYFSNKGGYKVVTIRSDNGSEFKNSRLNTFCAERGILRQFTIPYNSHQNGTAERSNRSIEDKSRCLLVESRLPLTFWNFSMMAAAYLLNITPSRVISYVSPWSVWYNITPNYNRIHPFGCEVYAHIPSHYRSKLQANGVRGIFLGYPTQHAGYLVYHIENQTVVVAKDVKFVDHIFPAETIQVRLMSGSLSGVITGVTLSSWQSSENDLMSSVEDFDMQVQTNNDPNYPTNDDYGSEVVDEQVDTDAYVTGSTLSHDLFNSQVSSHSDFVPSLTSGRSSSISMSDVPDDLDLSIDGFSAQGFGLIVDHIHCLGESAVYLVKQMKQLDMAEEKENNVSRKKRFQIANQPMISSPQEYTDFVSINNIIAAATLSIPRTYKEALLSPEKNKWLQAMEEEMTAHEINGTWKIADLPNGVVPIGSRWILNKKADGRHKARLIAQGYTQVEGVNYEETFAPVIRSELVKLLLALAARTGKKLEQMDMSTAFLNAPIQEQIFVKPAPGYELPKGKVYALQKLLYGLKQAPNNWNNLINEVLVKNGFERVTAELGIYIKENVYLGLYVDDLIIATNSDNEMNNVKEMLHKNFKMRDLHSPERFLGLNIQQRDDSVTITLHEYIQKMLKDCDMLDANSVNSPADKKDDLEKIDLSPVYADLTKYRSIVGKLLYASTVCRYDISHIVSILTRFFHKPEERHMRAAKRVLRYLKGTSKFGITYNNTDGIQAFTDLDWGNSLEDRRSISGYLIKLGGGAISWSLKKQVTVALSSTEAEYLGMTEIVKEIMWLIQVLDKTDVEVELPLIVYADNQSAIALGKHPVLHGRTKHIDIRHHFIREKESAGLVKFVYISTRKMEADLLTKTLSSATFKSLRDMTGLKYQELH